MYGTKLVTPQLLNGLEIEARLQTYLQYGITLEELEPVASEFEPQQIVFGGTGDGSV
jgi:hypothetical protein